MERDGRGSWYARDLARLTGGEPAAAPAGLERGERVERFFLTQVLPVTRGAVLAAADLRPSPERAWAWPWRLPLALAGATVAALLAAWVVPWGAAPGEPGVRAKGELGLQVTAERGGRVFTVVEGAPLAEGDRVQFEVTAPAAGWLALVSVEQGGRTTPFVPATGGRALSVPAGRSRLPGAIRLDGYLGREWLVAVFAPTPFDVAEAARLAASVAGAGAPAVEARLPAGFSRAVLGWRKARSGEAP